MTAETHPDPFHDAMGQGLQRALHVGSSVVTGAQVYLYLTRTQAMAAAERDERARRVLAAQMRAEREAARAGWAPALDPDWLRQADLFQAASTWGAAIPYADRSVPWYEPTAATAMRKSEERLRDLHPHAMTRYDRLRADGMAPADAMRETAPIFAGAPRAYDTPYTPRPLLDPGTGENPVWTPAAPKPDPAGPGLAMAEAQHKRGRQIITALQARARTHHRGPLGEAELRTVLETVTNLPADVIDQIVSTPSAAASRTTGTGAAVTTATPRPGAAARPWEHDFPVPIHDVVAGAPAPAPAQPTLASARAARRPRGGRHRR
jgi:hypothetical protein